MATFINCIQVESFEVTDNNAKGLRYRNIFDANRERRLHTNYVTVRPGGNTRSHSHDWEHISYIISGEGELEFGNGQREAFSPGMAVYIPGGEKHCFRNTGTIELVIFGVLGPMPLPDDL